MTSSAGYHMSRPLRSPRLPLPCDASPVRYHFRCRCDIYIAQLVLEETIDRFAPGRLASVPVLASVFRFGTCVLPWIS